MFHGATVSEAEVETMEKKGMALGRNALHPVIGEAVPIYAANFVRMSDGSGAVLAVPAHDQRDWEFAKQYDLHIQQVIEARNGEAYDIAKAAFTDLAQDGEPIHRTSRHASRTRTALHLSL